MATGRGGPRNKRIGVTPLPLAGGGATGGSIYVDPTQYRDRTRKARDAGYSMTVADQLTELLQQLEVNQAKPEANARGPVAQFAESLNQVAQDFERDPMSNAIEPYRQAFRNLISTPEGMQKAAFILALAELKPSASAALVGEKGYKPPNAPPEPQARPTLVQEGVRFAGEGADRQMVYATYGERPIGQQGRKQAAPLPAFMTQGPLTEQRFKPVEAMDIDETIPGQPSRMTIPHRFDSQGKIQIDADEIAEVEDPGIRNPQKPDQNPSGWTASQHSRGWRMVVYPPLGEAPQKVATGVSGDTRIAQQYVDMWTERYKGEVMRGKNTRAGKAADALLNDYEALIQNARQNTEADFSQKIEQEQKRLQKLPSNDRARRESEDRLRRLEAMRDEHMASFDALQNPRRIKADRAADPSDMRRVLEVIKGRAGDLMPTPPTFTRGNPDFKKVRQIYMPTGPRQEVDPGPVFRRDVEQGKADPADKIAALSPESRFALEKAQDLSSALQAGRQISSQQEIAPNQVEGMRQVPLANEMVWFDNTEQGRELRRALEDIMRRHPEIRDLVDAGAAYAPAPEGPDALPTRGQAPISLSQLMGNYDLAKKYYYEDRLPNRPPALVALLKPAQNVEMLADITGRKFYPKLPATSSTVGPLNKGLTADDLPENFAQLTPAQQKRVREDLASRIEGSTGDLWMHGVGSQPGVDEALKLIDAEAREHPKWNKINKKTGQLYVNPETNLPYERWDISPETRSAVIGLLDRPDAPAGGPVILRYGTTTDTDPVMRRQVLGRERSPAMRIREQIAQIVEGKSQYVPTAARGLMPGKTYSAKSRIGTIIKAMDPAERRELREFVTRSINQGGILPLDERAGYWRGNFMYLDPTDGNVYFGQLSPEVLAMTIAQQIEQYDPNFIRQMIPLIRRSMEVYRRLPVSGQAAKVFDPNTGLPTYFTPSDPYKEKLQIYMQQNNKRLIPRPDGLVVPGADQVSATAPRFSADQFQAQPLSGLLV